jgi:hypothetical protein
MAFQTSTNNYQNNRYIVGAGIDCYPTVQSAINAANAAGGSAVVFLREGTYTENLTLYTTVHVEGCCDTLAFIVGTHTPPTSGSVVFANVGLSSGTHILSSAAAGSTSIEFNQCSFNTTNGYVCNLTNWTGPLSFIFCNDSSTNNGLIYNTAAATVNITNSVVGNGTNVLTANGVLLIFNGYIKCPVTLIGNALSVVSGGSFFTKVITTGGNADLGMVDSASSTGSDTAIVHDSSITLRLTNYGIRTTNAVAISGSGSVQFNSVSFPSSKGITATEVLTGVTKTGEIYANTIQRMKMTGFYSWAAGGPYFDDTTLGTFSLLVGGTGYVKGKLVTWVAQNITGLTAGNTYYIYIDSTGTIGKATAHTDALYEDYIVLFECLRDSTGTNNQLTVAENHPYSFQTGASNYLHDIVGPVIQNTTNGANIVISGTQKIGISGDDVLSDHGLDTTITATATVTSWLKYYTNAGGKWARQNATDSFTGYWNSAGTPTALGAGRWAVYTLYVTKNNLNSAGPVYIAVLNTSDFGSSGAANTAIANGITAKVSGELAALEIAQLGYIIYRQSTAAITTVTISKSTLKATLSTGGTNTASLVVTDTANFNGILSASDTNVQAALDTIDDAFKWSIVTGDTTIVVGNRYIANKASVINFTLPTTSAVGSMFRLSGMQAAVAWRVVQGANQIMHFGSLTSTTGAGGYIEATAMHDSVECVCIVANLEWVVVSVTGNITVA